MFRELISNQPLMTYDCNNIAYKNLNPLAINYKTSFIKELIRGDYFSIRLINDNKSSYQIIQKQIISTTNNTL